MIFEQLFRFVFVLYCTTVGVVLLLAPWTPGWSQIFLHLPGDLPQWLTTSWARGGMSGFGLVHLLWGLHDLGAFLQPPSPSQSPSENHAAASAAFDGDQ